VRRDPGDAGRDTIPGALGKRRVHARRVNTAPSALTTPSPIRGPCRSRRRLRRLPRLAGACGRLVAAVRDSATAIVASASRSSPLFFPPSPLSRAPSPDVRPLSCIRGGLPGPPFEPRARPSRPVWPPFSPPSRAASPRVTSSSIASLSREHR